MVLPALAARGGHLLWWLDPPTSTLPVWVPGLSPHCAGTGEARVLGCFRKLPPWGFHCTLRLNAEVPSSDAAPGWGARPWGDAWGGCGSRDPPQLITQVLLCKGGHCKQCLERSHYIPSWAQHPWALPCGGFPLLCRTEVRDKGWKVQSQGLGSSSPWLYHVAMCWGLED